MPATQSLSRRQRWALVGLFLLAFVPRVYYPVSRPLQWYDRSARFVKAVLHGDLKGTLFSEHPGVTVMWLSGGAQWGWYGLRSLFDSHAPRPLETPGYAFADRVAVGVWPLALVISLGVLWAWCLLARLFDRRTAWVAATLWALDPFYLANSKTLHLDALLSTLMLLSALHTLLYVRDGKRYDLLCSGILGGLALLTKSSAIFLAPYLGLCLLSNWTNLSMSRLKPQIIQMARSMSLWLLIAAAVYFLLWPSLWVQPGASWDVIYRKGFVLHANTPRDQPLFYRGVVGQQDPGPRFYLDVLGFRSTFLTLPFAVVGLGGISTRKRQRRSLLLLVGFAFFFFGQMSLGQWKDGRYMLPVLLVLDILAAVGLLGWAEGISRWRLAGRRQLPLSLSQDIVSLLLAFQAVLVLSYHPYYGNHYNFLLGGLESARRVFPPADFGEGLDGAGQYIDQLPDAAGLTVATQFLANEMLAQYVRVDVRDIAEVGEQVDYLVFGVQYTMRSRGFPRWGALWDVYKFRPPAYVVRFGGVPFAWVYPARSPTTPTAIAHRLQVSLQSDSPTSTAHQTAEIHLMGYRLEPEQAVPGDSLWLTLYWQSDGPLDTDYTVFTHLIGPDGQLLTQQDNPPGRGTHPTSAWTVGELIEDPYELVLPGDTPLGDYTLYVGMYDPSTGERLAATADGGAPPPQDRVALITVPVRPLVPRWQRALGLGWLVIVGLGGVVALRGQPIGQWQNKNELVDQTDRS